MPWRIPKIPGEYRDVGTLLQYLRTLLLGRKHQLHGRFPKYIAPRSIPKPDVPRTLEYKYSKQYYFNRSYMDSSYPPVVTSTAKAQEFQAQFKYLPTPGDPWWWDGHAFYETVPSNTPRCPPQASNNPCPCPTPPKC
ncbi:NADH:ubiquinone oxidoreductase subunit b14.5a (Complex i-B14.5a) domain-containing protein [Phthorimaea operculella]|nr:NADH:ubiquinone oxidoreductase subunit b14.5a (Complex i-B14.5a) domain-containing protein [Phthorimaea operculella]